MAHPIRQPNALEVVEELHDRFGFTYRELAGAVHADEATLHRWRKGTGAAPSPVYLARLGALRAFVEELGRTFRRGEDAAAWLDRPAPVFGGDTPRAQILAGHVDRVTGVLYAFNAGVLA
jgi:hypothetical protein